MASWDAHQDLNDDDDQPEQENSQSERNAQPEKRDPEKGEVTASSGKYLRYDLAREDAAKLLYDTRAQYLVSVLWQLGCRVVLCVIAALVIRIDRTVPHWVTSVLGTAILLFVIEAGLSWIWTRTGGTNRFIHWFFMVMNGRRRVRPGHRFSRFSPWQ
jgi:hypothetical protein